MLVFELNKLFANGCFPKSIIGTNKLLHIMHVSNIIFINNIMNIIFNIFLYGIIQY